MGTSRSLSTPKGKKWRSVKSDITSTFSGTRDIPDGRIVSGVVSATGGIGGGGASSGGRRTKGITKAISRLGGFGAVLTSSNLEKAIKSLDLPDLKDKSATEIVSIVAERLSSDVSGIEAEALKKALQDAILEASQLTDEGTYADLEKSLQKFLQQEGIRGLVELFLVEYIFDFTWVFIEKYAQEKAKDGKSLEAFMTAHKSICETKVKEKINEISKANHLSLLIGSGKKAKDWQI
jgi:hypothetical protein